MLLLDTYRSPSIHEAIRKVNTGVQNIMADALPRGTIFIAVNTAAKSKPPSRPCVTVRMRDPTGPRYTSNMALSEIIIYDYKLVPANYTGMIESIYYLGNYTTSSFTWPVLKVPNET